MLIIKIKMAEYDDYFLDGANLQSSTAVYTTSELITLAADGYYSDGLVVRRQVSSIGLLAVESCPACDEFSCEQNITIQPEVASACKINYKMNANVGAVKITISGMTQLNPHSKRPTGIFIKGTGALPPAVNSFSSVGDSGALNNVITAPSDTVPSYFFNNTPTGCANWTAGAAELPEYKYNPNTQSFEPTGTLDSYTFTNKLTSPVAGLNLTTGTIITYVPKSSVAQDVFEVSAIYPCGGEVQNRPTINVECPTLLYEFNGTLSTTFEEGNVEACDNLGSGGGKRLVHGKVRGTVDGQFKNGDYIFYTNTDDSGVYSELADGYWKSLRVYFPEATGGGANIYCSFKVTNNIISNVLACQ